MFALLLGLSLAPPRVNLDDVVIYEVNLRAFGPEPGFVALRKQLPRIRRLGANTLWLMPIHPIGQVRSVGELGSPYSVRDYRALNPEFGTTTDFRSLLREAKRLGFRVIMDWVANHTAWDHAWIASHPEFYVRSDKGEIIIPPGTNWNDVAELNYENLAMRREMVDAMRYWTTTYGIDGFRCDHAEGSPNDFWIKAIRELRASAGKKPLLMLAEAHREDLVTEAGFDLLYDWGMFTTAKQVFGGTRAATHFLKEAIKPSPPRLRFVTNHDEAAWDGPMTKLFGSNPSALAAFEALTLTGGVPLIYSSQELGYEKPLPFFSKTTLNWSSQPEIQNALRNILLRRDRLGVGVRPTLEDASTQDVVAFRVKLKSGWAETAINVRNTTVSFAWPAGWGKRSGSITLPPHGVHRSP